MILLDVRRYIHERGATPLPHLCARFGLDEATMLSLLGELVARGMIREKPPGSPCPGGCTRCTPAAIRLFAARIGDSCNNASSP